MKTLDECIDDVLARARIYIAALSTSSRGTTDHGDLLRDIDEATKRRHHHHHHRVAITIDDFSVILNPNEKAHIMLNVTVGHTVSLGYHFVDTDGNPMQTPPVADPSPAPQWQNTPSSPPVDTFTVAPDGSSAGLAASAAGTDAVSLSVSVGGVVFSASLQVTIAAAPQVLGGIVIDAKVS